MQLEIVEVGPDRVAEVHDVWIRAGLHFRPDGRDSADHLSHQLGSGTAMLLGAVSDDVLIAVVLVTDDGRKGWINRLAVLPEHRRSGIGRRLVVAAEQMLDDRGIAVAAALVESGNTASHAMFEAAGYSRAPVTYYRKPLADPEA